MQRREFMKLTAAMLASGALTGYLPRALATASSNKGMDAKAFHASRRFLQTSFGRIAYIERGTGDVALFLHGFPLNSFQWRGALDRLSSHRRCIAPDFMGLGYTEVAEGTERCARCAGRDADRIAGHTGYSTRRSCGER